MIDVPLSAVAWISVVLIQAVIHYFVLGHRRRRVEQEAEDLALEESLSLAETLSLADTSDDSASIADDLASQETTYQIPMSPMFDRSERMMKSQGDINISLLGKTLVSEMVRDGSKDSQEFIDFLSSTGTELLKVSSRKRKAK
jgi:flagellum-specific peptidoglycan hydrolase FlgJ